MFAFGTSRLVRVVVASAAGLAAGLLGTQVVKASTVINVPCSTPSLVAAITTANKIHVLSWSIIEKND